MGTGTGVGSVGVSGTGVAAGVSGSSYTGGVGVFGASVGANGIGLSGSADVTTGIGVSGSGFIVCRVRENINGVGVLGTADPSTGIGVSGSANIGVYGTSTGNGSGVFGYSTNATSPAVIGVNTIPVIGYAGIFSGNVEVAGIFTATAKFFKIDHPLDPEHKYLNHSTVESPDMKNMYDGVVTLGADGEAWVELPAYFEALNKDFCYQLTAIGAPEPSLYIAQEVHGNRFQIAGGSPGGKVSWQVTGIRRDPYAEKYRLPTEQDKSAAEQGYYLHPEVYGQPASKGIDSLRIPAAPRGKNSPGKSSQQ